MDRPQKFDFQKRVMLETEEGWMPTIQKMPFIKFKPDWQVKVIPPFCGAIARFFVKLPNDVEVSVYCDWFDALGSMGKPYWEIYPLNVRGAEPERFMLDEVDEMLSEIEKMGALYG